VAKTKEQIKSKDMRKILFKAKCLSDGKWYQGFYYETPNGISYIRNDKYTVQVDPATVCQFTGLCDKNGARIFERDKIKCENRVKNDEFVIEFENCEFIVNDGFDTRRLYYFSLSNEIEVIGNIHDK
jgi:hypothetical protein